MRTAVYLRSASAENESFEAQRDVCLAYASDNGHSVIATYEDVGQGGLPNKGGGLSAMLADACAGTFTALIIKHPDRLSRHDGQLIDVLTQLATCKVVVLCVDVPDVSLNGKRLLA